MGPKVRTAGVAGVARRRLMVGYCGALAFLVVLSLAPGVARASGTLDQSQTDSSGGAFVITGPNYDVGLISQAQTFTAGLTGGLDEVDLYLGTSSPAPTAPLTVEIRNTSGGAPGSSVLASASVPAASVPAYPGGWVEVDFASPAAVTSGTQYAIVGHTGDTGEFTQYAWYYGNFDPYTGGALWNGEIGLTIFPPPIWTEDSTRDYAFKTYVSPATSASEAAMLVAASTGVGSGHALLDKASAIQTAVNASPPQTATACADLTNYLGLVKAQTGKKLSATQATTLTTDANNLAATLGC